MVKNTTLSCAGLFEKGSIADTRKIQITGKSTFIVTLPKKWVLDSKLRAGAELGFSYQDDGSVLIVPPGYREKQLVKKISADRDFDCVERDITALYILGNCQAIEIHGTEITNEKRNMIRDLCKQLIGFEMVESSPGKIIIRNLLSTEEFTLEKATKRMFSLVYLMFDDLIRVLNENDDLLCKDLISRGIEIDRTYFLISRVYLRKMNLKNHLAKEDLSLTQAFYYRMAAEEIDNTGDLITKIAMCFENGNASWELTSCMTEMCSTLKDLFRDSFESFKLTDIERSGQIITRGKELGSCIETARKEICFKENARLDILFDSCIRIRDHISKIAKLSIELSHL
jgi:phosphate uptake regulator